MKTIRKNIIAVLAILLSITTFSCTDQQLAKSYGGTYTIKLEPGVKLENVTFKEEGMWYLTRKMREGEKPEKHEFIQEKSSVLNITGNGKVIFIESK